VAYLKALYQNFLGQVTDIDTVSNGNRMYVSNLHGSINTVL
jgi:hypothetical protein